MAYVCINSRGVAYYLHGKTVVLQNGRPMPIYAFNRRLTPAAALDALPTGWRVAEKAGNGLPYLVRGPGQDALLSDQVTEALAEALTGARAA